MKREWLAVAAVLLGATAAGAQEASLPAPLLLVHPEAPSAPPVTVTLQDALQRARQNETQFQASVADAAVAHEDRVQAKAGLLPAFSHTTQYIGNQPTPDNINPNGRFVSMDGVHMYRSWAVMRQEISPGVVMRTPLRKAEAAEAMAAARLEIAQRGLAVTVTRSYYGLVAAQRKYATAQLAAQQAGRFLEIARRQEQLGQVARSDAIKADLQYQQQQQAFREATLVMDNARLALAVLLFPTLDENFSVVDDMLAAPGLPPITDVRMMAERGNPDLRLALETLRAAGQDVRTARNALLPTVAVELVYGIEANEFALHSRIAAQPELGVLPNLGYAVTVNLSVPIWDWGGLRSKVHQSETRERQAQTTLSQAQRQLVSNLYSMYNETLTARTAADSLRHVVDLAAESLRLINLRYEAGESTALEIVDAQNTLVQARHAADDADVRYRVAVAELQTLTGPF
jgi:outer membrane protein TolC